MMPLNKDQIKIVFESLKETYNEVDHDGKGKMTVFVNDPGRDYRKGILKDIQKTFKSSPWNATLFVPASDRPGKVKMLPVEIVVKPSSKVKSSSNSKPQSKPQSKAQFKPSDIVPPIVNEWLDAEEMIKNVEKYVKSLDLEKDIEKEILHLLKETGKDGRTSIPFSAPKDLIPAEFFEVLTSVKLAVLLKANDASVRKILGIPKKMDLKKSKIKIYIPKVSNFPLIDYYISVTASDKKDADSALKISVKSKVKSAKTNTVKFRDVFDKKQDVTNWYKGLNNTLKREQTGPKSVAEGALHAYENFKGKATFGVAVYSILNLLKDDRAKITSVIKQAIGDYISPKQFESILQQITKKMNTLSNTTDLKEVLDKQDYLSAANLIQGFLTKKQGEIQNSVFNMGYVCEKILVQASKETSVTKYNYYQMFFDEVLTKKEVAYAMSSLKGSTLKYEFYSKINFAQEYKSWLELRSKNSPNSPSDAIGIDV